MKKIKTAIIFLIIAASLQITAFGIDEVSFSDINDSHWAYNAIDKLTKAGIIKGYKDGTFRPEGDITRAEFTVIINQIFNYTEKLEESSFADVSKDEWYCDYILIAEKQGYIKGYTDNTFRPGSNIRRQEVCVILDNILKLSELPMEKNINDIADGWTKPYIVKVVSNRIMTVDENGNFRGEVNATRADVCDAVAKFVVDAEVPSIDENTGSQTGGSNSDNGNSEEDEQKEINDAISRVIKRLENRVLSDELITSGEQSTLKTEIINDIIDNMQKYYDDNSYDIKPIVDKVYKKYEKLAETERTNLKNGVSGNVDIDDLLLLKEFFF